MSEILERYVIWIPVSENKIVSPLFVNLEDKLFPQFFYLAEDGTYVEGKSSQAKGTPDYIERHVIGEIVPLNQKIFGRDTEGNITMEVNGSQSIVEKALAQRLQSIFPVLSDGQIIATQKALYQHKKDYHLAPPAVLDQQTFDEKVTQGELLEVPEDAILHTIEVTFENQAYIVMILEAEFATAQ